MGLKRKLTTARAITSLFIIGTIILLFYRRSDITKNVKQYDFPSREQNEERCPLNVNDNTHANGFVANLNAGENGALPKSNRTVEGEVKSSLGWNCMDRHPVLSARALPLVALASPWGSGNTWTRHLLQQATGVATGSVYCDVLLFTTTFPCECTPHRRHTLVVKTHEPEMDTTGQNPHRTAPLNMTFDKAILLIRNPYDFIVSNNHRDHMLEVPSEDAYFSESWRKSQPKLLDWWNRFNRFWLEEFPNRVKPVLYESLKSNTKQELMGMLDFLGWKYSDHDIACTLNRREGQFHRRSKKWTRVKTIVDLFEVPLQRKINNSIISTAKLLKEKFNVSWVLN